MPYSKILANSKILSHHQGLKLQASFVAKEYFVAVQLNNAHTCIYGSTVSECFDVIPTTLSELMRCHLVGINIGIQTKWCYNSLVCYSIQQNHEQILWYTAYQAGKYFVIYTLVQAVFYT